MVCLIQQRLIIGLNRSFEIAIALLAISPIVERVDIARIDRKGTIEARNRRGAASSLRQCITQMNIRRRNTRINGNRPAKLPFSLFVAIFRPNARWPKPSSTMPNRWKTPWPG